MSTKKDVKKVVVKPPLDSTDLYDPAGTGLPDLQVPSSTGKFDKYIPPKEGPGTQK